MQAKALQQHAAELEGPGLPDLYNCDRGQAASWAQHGPRGVCAGQVHHTHGYPLQYLSVVGGGYKEVDLSQGVYKYSLL